MPTSAEKFISDNGAKVHDRVRIEAKDLIYEGLILPKIISQKMILSL